MAQHDESEEKSEVHRVDTVPPPPGEDDAYSAPTRIGPLAEVAALELMRQAESAASGVASGTITSGSPSRPPSTSMKPPVPTRPPVSSNRPRMFASNQAVELGQDLLVDETPPPRLYADEEDEPPTSLHDGLRDGPPSLRFAAPSQRPSTNPSSGSFSTPATARSSEGPASGRGSTPPASGRGPTSATVGAAAKSVRPALEAAGSADSGRLALPATRSAPPASAPVVDLGRPAPSTASPRRMYLVAGVVAVLVLCLLIVLFR